MVLSLTEAERVKKKQEKRGFVPTMTQQRILMNLFRAARPHGRSDSEQGVLRTAHVAVLDGAMVAAPVAPELGGLQVAGSIPSRVTKHFNRFR